MSQENQLIEEKLKKYQTIMENAKTAKIQAETRLESAQQRTQELEKRALEYGVPIHELPSYVDKLGEDIQAGIEQLEEALNPKPAAMTDEISGNDDFLPF